MVPRDERPIKVVMKDLPIFTNIDLIKTELEELRYVIGHVASWRGCEKFPKPKPPTTNRQPPALFSHRPTDNRTYAETLSNKQQSNHSTTLDFPALKQMAPLLQQTNSETDDLSIPELLNILKALNDLRVALKQNPGMLAMLRNIQLCKTPSEMFESLLQATVNPQNK
ncbi:hypothetical protein AVEN_191947-1 [Araneus ventricosus]|uniref:Uncharacterized protein n=1 Tax=Araneus ventricosus TaxID=182803 RepID=A0A4Y2S3C0_ARAVE|nr:hypothetical protein AVEN_191947-1 [Araneus ventricosus]